MELTPWGSIRNRPWNQSLLDPAAKRGAGDCQSAQEQAQSARLRGTGSDNDVVHRGESRVIPPAKGDGIVADSNHAERKLSVWECSGIGVRIDQVSVPIGVKVVRRCTIGARIKRKRV